MAILLNSKKSSASPFKIFPLVTLREGVIFPHTDVILSFGKTSSIASINQATASDNQVVFVSQISPRIDNPQTEDLYTVGTLCQINRTMPVNDEIHATVRGLTRVKIHKIQAQGKSLMAAIKEIPDLYEDTIDLQAMINHLITLVKKAVNLGKNNIEIPIFMRIVNSASPSEITDQVAAVLNLKNKERQNLLEETDLKKRLDKIIDYLSKEIKVLEIERKIANKTQKKFDQSMKEAVLRERMKLIQKELGESDEDTEINELRKKLETAKLPPEAAKKAFKELDRLAKLSIHNPEGGYLRSWLETMIDIPWNIASKNNVSLTAAARILKTDHYGLKDIKERILEYLAVMQLKKKQISRNKKPLFGSTVPTIICFSGPPGVGKTSVGKSIANSLGRKFARISLGGIRDEAEIRGHRRTYVGAMPGRVTQALIDAGTNNPVIMLDEIDKIGADYRGDPSAALLEVLDPEQNFSFVDHYLDVPLDLSKVLFITTANILETIPPALRDRLEIIPFSGYTEDEKLHIAKKHLINKQLEANALKKTDLNLPDDTIVEIVKYYTREAGVRGLERQISKIFRKAAKKIAGKSKLELPIKITPALLSKYLGPRRFNHTLAEENDSVGIVTGLAYTQTGGDILFIEVALMEGKGNIILTGQLGSVMKESAKAAHSYVRSHAKELDINPKVFAKTDIHLHVPEGAIPKDGPSAGVAMTTALISAFTKRSVKRLVGMTGEITLRGRVTEIGGLKEKSLAAHRAGLKEIIIPKGNKKDLVDIPSKVKKDLKIHFADNLADVLKIALNN